MIGIGISIQNNRSSRAKRLFSTISLDKFSDISNPMVDQSVAFPGPGTRNIVGAARWRTNGLAMYLDTGDPAESRCQYGMLAHVAGRAFLTSMGPSGVDINVDWGHQEFESNVFGWNKNGCKIASRTIIGPPGFGAYDQYAIVRLEDGHCAWLHRSMASPGLPWKHYFVTGNASTSIVSLAAGYSAGGWTGANASVDHARVVDFLDRRIQSREGMSEFHSAAPADQTGASSQDFLAHMTLATLPSSTLTFVFRRVSEQDYMYAKVSSLGAVTIGEVIGGNDTVLDASKTILAGSRLFIYADGSSVGLSVDTDSGNVSFWSGSCSGEVESGTEWQILSGGSDIEDMYIYPREPLAHVALVQAFSYATDPTGNTPSGTYGLEVTGGTGGVTIFVETEEELYNALSGIGDGLTPSTPRIIKFGENAPAFIDLTEDLIVSAASNITFDGSGSTTVVRRRDKKFMSCSNILFTDLTLAGAEYSYYSGLVHAVQFIGSHDIALKNCTFVFANDETVSFTGCDDVYIYRCLIGDALATGQAYGLFFAGGDCNRIIVLETALSNCHVRMPYTQGGAGNHFVRLYIHGSYVGPYVMADYGNIQLNMIDLVYGIDLCGGTCDWFKWWSYPLVPYVATAYWNQDTPYRLYQDQYQGNMPVTPDPIQDEDNIPTPTGNIEDLLDLLLDTAGRRVNVATPTFDAITTRFKERMIDSPDILLDPYWLV